MSCSNYKNWLIERKEQLFKPHKAGARDIQALDDVILDRFGGVHLEDVLRMGG